MIALLAVPVVVLLLLGGLVLRSRARIDQRGIDRALAAAKKAADAGRSPQAVQRYGRLAARLARAGTAPELAAQRGTAVLGQAGATTDRVQALRLYREAFPLLADPVAALPPWTLHALAEQRIHEGDRPEDLDLLLAYLGAVYRDPAAAAHTAAEPVLFWLQARCGAGAAAGGPGAGPDGDRDTFTTRALAALPQAEWTVLARAAALSAQGRSAEARAPLTAVAQAGGSAEVWFRLGAVLSRLGLDQEAVTAFSETLVRPPGVADPWGTGPWGRGTRLPVEARLFRGLAQQRLQHWEAASDDLLAAVRLGPGDPRTHYALGCLALDSPTPDRDTAHACFIAALRADPRHAPARFGLGLLHEWSGEVALAAAEYQAGTALRPDWRPGRIRLGAALCAAGQHADAVRGLTTEADRPKDAWSDTAVFHLGLARAGLGSPDAALDSWQALPDDRHQVLARNRAVLRSLLAARELTERRPGRAMRLWETCVAAFPDTAEYRTALVEAGLREAGLALLTGRDRAESLDRADAALAVAARHERIDGGSPRLRRLRGALAMLRDDAATAAPLLAGDRPRLAALQLAAGQPRTAIALLRTVESAEGPTGAGAGPVEEPALHRLRALLAARAGAWPNAFAAEAQALTAHGPHGGDTVTPGTPCSGTGATACNQPAVAGCGQCGRPACAAHLHRSRPPAAEPDGPQPADTTALQPSGERPQPADATVVLGTVGEPPTEPADTAVTTPLPTRCHTCLAADLPALLAHALRTGRPEEAVPLLAAWAAVLPRDSAPAAPLRNALPRIRLHCGDPEAALAEAVDAGADADTLRLVQLHRAAAAAAAGDLELTLTALREVEAVAPDDPVAAAALPLLAEHEALAHSRAGRHADAWDRFHQLWQDRPQDLRALHSLGLASYRLASERGVAEADDAVWEWTLACWAAALHHPGLWPGIAEATGRPVPEDRGQAVRTALTERIRQDFLTRDAAHGTDGDGPSATGWAVRWGLECQAAATLARYAPTLAAESGPAQPVVRGPLLQSLLPGARQGRALAQDLDLLLRPDHSGPLAEQLRPLFGPLGAYWYLVQQKRFDDAADGLRALSTMERGTEGSALLATAVRAGAQEHYAHQRWAAALDGFEEVARLGAELTPAHRTTLADAGVKEAQRLLGEDRDAHQAAVDVLVRTLALAPGNPTVAANLSAGYSQLGLRANNQRKDYPEAVRLLRLAVKHAPEDPTAREFTAAALTNWANQLMNAEDDASLAQAGELLTEALKLEGSKERRLMLSNVLYARSKAIALTRSRLDTALELMTQSVLFDPESDGTDLRTTAPEAERRLSVVLHNRGVELLKAKNHQGGVAFLLAALQVQNNQVTRQQLADAYCGEAYRLANRSQFRSARNEMRTGLGYDPQNKDLLTLQAALRRRGY
ncbi:MULTISPECIES: hypothetical protein [Streptacidiphilus]|uniref:Tetratricopeptide repeat protein n=1 Tax=Streptacidiphilus cavernicola TaxID=3342716 RepID=A0ABV6USS5_9ACTN|nr:hypothetical protein [Streptacidiphilus jeojiense]